MTETVKKGEKNFFRLSHSPQNLHKFQTLKTILMKNVVRGSGIGCQKKLNYQMTNMKVTDTD